MIRKVGGRIRAKFNSSRAAVDRLYIDILKFAVIA